TTCALVPPKPNELTAARRGCPSRVSQAVADRGRKNGPSPSPSFGFSSVTEGCGGRVRWWSASEALISPAIPAADMVWPMFALTDPSAVCAPSRGVQPCSRNSSASAPTSTTSPTVVAVPCASTYPTDCGGTPASAYARRSASSWPPCLGVIGPSLRPSLLHAEPRISA